MSDIVIARRLQPFGRSSTFAKLCLLMLSTFLAEFRCEPQKTETRVVSQKRKIPSGRDANQGPIVVEGWRLTGGDQLLHQRGDRLIQYQFANIIMSSRHCSRSRGKKNVRNVKLYHLESTVLCLPMGSEAVQRRAAGQGSSFPHNYLISLP